MKYFPAVMVICSLSTGASVAAAADRAGYCADISNYAERIMFIRQMGQPIESQMKSALYQFDTPAEQAAAQALVTQAWSLERSSTSKNQQKQIAKFSESAKEACLAGDIFSA